MFAFLLNIDENSDSAEVMIGVAGYRIWYPGLDVIAYI